MRTQGTPGEPCSPADYADAAAEAVFGLNHGTFAGTGYEVPSDVYRVLGQLATMLARLPQALSQTSDRLAREEAAGRVGHDQLSDAGAVEAEVAVLLGALAEVRQKARYLHEFLDRAHQVAAHLTRTQAGRPSSGCAS